MVNRVNLKPQPNNLNQLIDIHKRSYWFKLFSCGKIIGLRHFPQGKTDFSRSSGIWLKRLNTHHLTFIIRFSFSPTTEFIFDVFTCTKYRKIPKISPGAYICQRPFLRGLFLEGLISEGLYVRREICVSKSIGLACGENEFYHFCFVVLCIGGQIPSTSPPGCLYSGGRGGGAL